MLSLVSAKFSDFIHNLRAPELAKCMGRVVGVIGAYGVGVNSVKQLDDPEFLVQARQRLSPPPHIGLFGPWEGNVRGRVRFEMSLNFSLADSFGPGISHVLRYTLKKLCQDKRGGNASRGSTEWQSELAPYDSMRLQAREPPIPAPWVENRKKGGSLGDSLSSSQFS